MIELDHIFVCVASGGPEGDRLREIGLTEGSPNRHPGQGTACRRFFLRNAYIELLWVEDEIEARGEIAGPVHLWERWAGREGACCPFGILMRPGVGGERAPFAVCEYRPPYLPVGMGIEMGMNAGVTAEPVLAYLPGGMAGRPDAAEEGRRQPLVHAGGFGEITRVRMMGPWPREMSEEMRAVERAGVVELARGERYCVEIGIDGEQRGMRVEVGAGIVVSW